MSEKRAPYTAATPARALLDRMTELAHDSISQARAVLDASATERELLLYVLQLARLHGWLVRHDWTRLHSPSGYPDLTLLRPPRLVYAELKRESGKPTERQAEWIEALSVIQGVEIFVWRPRDAEEIAHVLE